jgi:HEXXH motif-containing protein
MISGLTERLEIALSNLGNSPWLPELTAELVEVGWRNLYCKAGLSRDGYGTARAMSRDAGGPRRIVARLPIFSDSESSTEVFQVETLDAEFIRHYEEAGVRFYTASEIDAANILTKLREAINVLKSLHTLFTTVTALVRSIHLIEPDHDDYDVSFSEPHIPFSIFVSVPQASSITNALRVAEAIVHEAMHLQLTLIEQVVPLVCTASQQYYSPWRGEFRTAQGVLHGLYVFFVIDLFFYALQSLPLRDSNSVGYIKRRRSEIRDQIGCMHSFEASDDLTEIGRAFTRRMMTRFE